MNTPKTIYIGQTIWSEEKIHDHSPAYFSEEAVLSIIQEAYEYQCPAYGKKYEEGYSDGNKDACNAIKEAIKKLKGGAK